MDLISLVLDLFAGFVILIIVIAGIAFLRALFKSSSPSTNQTQSRTEEHSSSRQRGQIAEDIREDSEGDGLMLFDDPMFPPEFDDEEDDF